MRMILTRTLIFSLGLGVLAGCANTQERTSLQAINTKAQISSTPTKGDVQPGMMMELPANNELSLDEAEVLREYHAASGKLCRQLLIGKLSQRTRIMCQQKDGSWQFARALIDSSALQNTSSTTLISQSANNEAVKDEEVIVLAAASEKIQVVPVSKKTNTGNEKSIAAPPLKLRIEKGETLWSFAERTTGNPNNWSVIADANNIDDVENIPGGSFLTVPADLLTGM